MELRFYKPDAEQLTQQIEHLEKSWVELTAALDANPDNKGTAARIADVEAEHTDLTAQLDAIPVVAEDPMREAIDQKIEEIKAAQIQGEILAVLDPLKNEDDAIDCDEAIAVLEALKASQPDPKADGGQTT